MSTTSLPAVQLWPNTTLIDLINGVEVFTAGATGSNRDTFIADGWYVNQGQGVSSNVHGNTIRYETVLVVKNADGSNPHDIIFDHQKLDSMGTWVNPKLDTVTYTIPAGATVMLGPFATDGQWYTTTGTISAQGGASTYIVPLITFHVSDANLKVAPMARQLGLSFGYPDDAGGA